jgi:AmmeMemoRadiSam system protein A
MSPLSEDDRRALLRLARRAIVEAVVNHRALDESSASPALTRPAGAFVTLHHHGRLRGCIGHIEATEPLADTIVRCATSAALQDPRFDPLRPAEISGLEIEISILTPPEIARPDEIEIGRHGLLISCGWQRGLLLPQVAVEHGLSREHFLEETCRKAGLPLDAWNDPATEIRAFTCEVFSERELGEAPGASRQGTK